MTFHPTGFKDGRKLTRYILWENKKLKLVIRNWNDYQAIDGAGNVILDFVDYSSRNVSTDGDGMFVELNGFSYTDIHGNYIGMRMMKGMSWSRTLSRVSSRTCLMCCRSSASRMRTCSTS